MVRFFCTLLPAIVFAEVGDFSPLDSGNTWKYHGVWEARFYTSAFQRDTLFRTVQVKSKVKVEDTLKYTLRISDSICSWNASNSNIPCSLAVWSPMLVELPDGSIVKPILGEVKSNRFPISDLFYRHKVPEAQIKTIDLDGTSQLAFDSTLSTTATFSSLRYVQNLGLLESKSGFGWKADNSSQFVHLTEFNGRPIYTQFVLPIQSPEKARSSRFPHRRGFQSSVFHGNVVNVLGRTGHLQ